MNVFLKRYQEFLDVEKLRKVVIPKSIRVNTLKIGEKEIVKRLSAENVQLEKIGFLDFGYLVKKSAFSLGSAPEFLMGYYYVQEAASQIPVRILNPNENETVLDMAASPGGKATQIAQFVNNKGTIIAVDKERHRINALKNNIERLGVKNCIVYNIDGADARNLGIEFDKILLDAPCSGSFLTDPKWFDKKNIRGFKERQELQKRLLSAGISVLKKGGTLVYSTCSLEPEENEEVIDWAIANLPVKTEKIELKIGKPALLEFEGRGFGKEVQKCVRIIPYENNTQPFFIAKIAKK